MDIRRILNSCLVLSYSKVDIYGRLSKIFGEYIEVEFEIM